MKKEKAIKLKSIKKLDLSGIIGGYPISGPEFQNTMAELGLIIEDLRQNDLEKTQQNFMLSNEFAKRADAFKLMEN